MLQDQGREQTGAWPACALGAWHVSRGRGAPPHGVWSASQGCGMSPVGAWHVSWGCGAHPGGVVPSVGRGTAAMAPQWDRVAGGQCTHPSLLFLCQCCGLVSGKKHDLKDRLHLCYLFHNQRTATDVLLACLLLMKSIWLASTHSKAFSVEAPQV